MQRASRMNKKTAKIINIVVVVSVLIGFNLILYIQTGNLNKEPKTEAKADNCYTETLRVVTDEDYDPYSFYDESGNPAGYDVEYITLVANEMEMNLDLELMSWSEGIEAIQNGEADMLLSCGYLDSFAGAENLIMSSPVAVDEYAVYSRYIIDSADSLYGKKIAVMENGNVLAIIEMMKLSDYVVLYPDNESAMKAVKDGEADCAIMREKVGEGIARKNGYHDIYRNGGIAESFICFGINKDKPELESKVNNAIERIKISGQAEKLRKKWLTTYVNPYTFREVLEKNLWLGLLVVMFILITFIIAYRKKYREVKEKEQLAKREHELQERLTEALGKAKNASDSKTEFLFNMSHDIRTPMNAILGYTDKGLQHAGDAEVAEESFKKIKIAGAHLLNLINDILEMSRIESGHMTLSNQPLDVTEAIEGVEQMSQSLAMQKSIDFEAHSGNLINTYIYADELHINEVIINLISNAIKYTKEGGKVRFIVNQLGPVMDGMVRYRFEVTDTGIGMSEEFQEHLFESFSREENATVAKIEGAGLGLSIVKRIVDLANGTITVKSVVKEGTRFTVEIPFKVMEESEIAKFIAEKNAEKKVVVNRNFEGKKVLLVEDNEMNREISTDILTEAGLSVESAEDGKIAVKKVTEKGTDYYDYVLMDIQMPVMNGYDAATLIRELPGGENVPIIALSANAFKEDVERSLAAGMNAHIAKPIELKALFNEMGKLSKR